MAGRRAPGFVDGRADEPLDGARAVPTNDGWRDLIADGEQQQRGMPRDRTRLSADAPDDVSPQPPIVEKRDVLRPRQSGHDTKTVIGRRIEHIGGRNGVGADGVDARSDHQREVAANVRPLRKLLPVVTGRKGAIGDAPHQEPFARDAQKLPVDVVDRCWCARWDRVHAWS